MNPGRGLIVFRIAIMRVGNLVMMMFPHRLVAVSKAIGPSRNWRAKQEKKTKQGDEEALHKMLSNATPA